MRISCVNGYQASSYQINRRMAVKQNQTTPETKPNSTNVNFNGYCGKIAGILAGGAAAVGLAVVAAPVLICAGPALAAAGMFAGDKAEDAINEAMDDKKD